MRLDPVVEFDEIILKKLSIGLKCSMPIDFQVNWNHYVDRWVAQLKTYIWAADVGRHEISVPSNWWEAFKERWFSDWLLKKYPVEYTVHIFDVKRTFPDFNVVIPGHEYKLRVFKSESLRCEKVE